MARLDPLPRDKMDPDFARHFDEPMRTGRRTGGPSVASMRNPHFFKLNQAMGDAIRARSLTPVERLIAALGEQRLVDLVITVGFFSMVGTTLSAFDIDPPPDDPIPLKLEIFTLM